MKTLLISAVVCLAFAYNPVEGCGDLAEMFILFRRGAVQLMNTCRNEYADIEEGLNRLLGFPVTSDQHWHSLLCDVARAKEVSELKEALQAHIAAAAPDAIGSQGILEIVSQYLVFMSEQLPELLNELEDFQSELQPWLVKTNFPYKWPAVNTDRQEIVHLMAEDFETQLYLILYDSDLCSPPDFLECANALLQARSLDEYLSYLGSDLSVDEETLQCQHGIQDLFRNNDEFRVIPSTANVLFRFIQRLDELGIVALVAEGAVLVTDI